MNSLFKKIVEKPIILLIAINILIGLVVFRDFGLNWDEPNAKMNHDGPPLVDWDKAAPAALAPAAGADLAHKGAWLMDVRDAEPFAAGHPADAIHIGIRGRFESWTGIMIPWGAPFVLVGSAGEVQEAALRLKRIGYDAPAGSLQGGVKGWAQAGLPTRTLELVKPAALHRQMQAGTAPIIVDVRLPTEWMGLRIGNVLNIPLNTLFTGGQRLSKDMPVLTVCNSAYRSSMGGAILLKMGFKTVLNMEGGSEAWITAGLPTLSNAGSEHAAAPAPVRPVKHPERLSAAELNRMLMDLPGTFEIVDVRPPAHFADFRLPLQNFLICLTRTPHDLIFICPIFNYLRPLEPLIAPR